MQTKLEHWKLKPGSMYNMYYQIYAIKAVQQIFNSLPIIQNHVREVIGNKRHLTYCPLSPFIHC